MCIPHPLQHIPTEPIFISKSADDTGRMDTNNRSPLRVFVVDESTLVRERLARHIGPHGAACIVGEAEDVETALQGIEGTDAEAVILDLRLIDSNGMDLLHALRSRTDPIVTIVLTNYASPVFRAPITSSTKRPSSIWRWRRSRVLRAKKRTAPRAHRRAFWLYILLDFCRVAPA
jgi:two-component system response regulator DevR